MALIHVGRRFTILGLLRPKRREPLQAPPEHSVMSLNSIGIANWPRSCVVGVREYF